MAWTGVFTRTVLKTKSEKLLSENLIIKNNNLKN